MSNKKGFYFTIIILFCIILLLLLSFEYKKQMTSDALKTRILSANNFVKSLERDASRAVYISSYRTMVSIIDYIAASNNYIQKNDDPKFINKVFAEALFNGTLEKTLGFKEVEGLLSESTLTDWQDKTKSFATVSGLEIVFAEPNPDLLIVNQSDPWFIKVSIPILYNITDPVSGVSWRRDVTINASIPIENTFEDPYYVIEFGKSCGNKIVKNTKWPLVSKVGGSCDYTNLTEFLESTGAGSKYIHTTRAPSYLDKLKGDINAQSQYGIESLVDTTKLYLCLGQVNNQSSVADFRYSSEVQTGLYRVNGATRIVLSNNPDSYYEATNESIYNITSDCLTPV